MHVRKICQSDQGGADSKPSAVSFCSDVVSLYNSNAGELPEDVPDANRQCFAKFRKEVLEVSKALLSLSGHINPGESDASIVKSMTVQGSTNLQSLSGLVSSALSTSGFWQDQVLNTFEV